MSAPVSNKTLASTGGAFGGVGLGSLVAELIGHMSFVQGTDPNVLAAAGALIVALFGAYGAKAVSWLVKESNDFLDYAATEAGKVLVDAQHAGVVPASVDVSGVEAKLEVLAQSLNQHLDADAERLLKSYNFPTGLVSTGVVQSDPAPAAPAPVEPVVPAPVTVPAAPEDPVLTDDTPPAPETDPVLAD